jgi:hypothetical protein
VKAKALLLMAGLALLFTLSGSAALAQDFPDVCQEPGNIMPNCNFDNGLNGWVPYLEDGAAEISVLQGGGECHAPLCPAAHVVTQSHFVGGIYQQVKVTPGNTYYANIVWLAFDALVNDASINSVVGGIGRRIGIDPTGGTDSRSSNVIWSEDNWRNDCKICNVEQVVATAQSDTITVFIRIDDTWRLRAAEKGYGVPPSKDQFWLDDIGMKQVDGSMAPAAAPTEPPPTDTPLPPPTDTPVPAPLVDAPEAESPTDTPTPAEVAQVETEEPVEAEVEQPVSPLPTPPPANTIAPPPTLTPSPTHSPTPPPEPTEPPPPTPTRRSRAESAPGEEGEPPVLSAGVLGAVGTTACVGGLVLLIIGAVMAGLVWLYRLGWGSSAADDYGDDDYDYPNPDNDIIINMDEP